MDIAADVGTEIGLHAKQAGYQAVGGFKEFGSEFFKQLFGGLKGQSKDEIDAAKLADDEFSNQAYGQQVEQMYTEFRAKQAREAQMKKEVSEQQKEEKKLEELNTKRAQRQDVTNAIGRSSAETGKSYGAE